MTESSNSHSPSLSGLENRSGSLKLLWRASAPESKASRFFGCRTRIGVEPWQNESVGQRGGKLPGVQQSMSGGQKPLVNGPANREETGTGNTGFRPDRGANLINHPGMRPTLYSQTAIGSAGSIILPMIPTSSQMRALRAVGSVVTCSFQGPEVRWLI